MAYKFTALVKDAGKWPWVAIEPYDFELAGDVGRGLVVDADEFDEICNSVDDSECREGDFGVADLQLPWTNKVNCDVAPGMELGFARCEMSMATKDVFVFLTICTCGDEMGNAVSEFWVVKVNGHGVEESFLADVSQGEMVPLDCVVDHGGRKEDFGLGFVVFLETNEFGVWCQVPVRG